MLKAKEGAQSITVGTIVPTRVGNEHKDYWARLYREGDLEAGVNLSECYEITGELSEALVIINEVLGYELGPELEAKALTRKAAQQKDSPAIAWKTISVAPFDEVSPMVRGKLHNQRGRILKELKRFDRAIIEYTAAAYYFELCQDSELIGLAHNNLASIYRKKKRYADAHESVDKAILLWRTYEYLPHALDQKALIHIDQKEYEPALDLAHKALAAANGKHRWRAEFLATLSHAQAGLCQFGEAMRSIDTALEISEYLSDQNLRLRILVARKVSCEIMYQVSDKHAVVLALRLSDSHRGAAKRLGVSHRALPKMLKKHSLSDN